VGYEQLMKFADFLRRCRWIPMIFFERRDVSQVQNIRC